MATTEASSRPVARVDGFAPIRDYAAIGDGRTVALVCRDGSVDWLAVPTIDSPPLFWSILDPERGGRFALAPEAPFETERNYVEGTNVLETTFRTAGGAVRVTDAITLQDGGLLPWFELARRVECLAGEVRMRWAVEPRPGFGGSELSLERRDGTVLATDGQTNLTVLSFDAGDPGFSRDALGSAFSLREGGRALLALISSQSHPLPLPPRDEIDLRLDGTADAWRRWLAGQTYDGPWRDAVERSALALKLLIYAPSGAIAAAPTTSLPEKIGGSRNYDYRYSWVRDSTLTLDALIRLGYREQAHASFSWLLDAAWRSHPRLNVIYTLETDTPPSGQPQEGVRGYRGSQPVLVGNGAAEQTQLGGYGNFLETAWLYVREGNILDHETARRMEEVAGQLARIWRNPDAGIWELRGQMRDYTESKIMAWVCLDRAVKLAEAGQLSERNVEAWRSERAEIEAYVERECWSEAKRSYTFYAGSAELDAATLLASRMSYGDPARERMQSTIAAIRSELGAGGPLLYRFTGMRDQEGAFLACSFWLVEALARAGRVDEAADLMDETVALANDVGLFSEEIDPGSKELLGNFPQGITHLSLVGAATILEEAAGG